jgi:hypothetical protein
MYTLRKIVNEVQSNTNLGNSYQLVGRELNYDEFSKAFRVFFDYHHVADLETESDSHTRNCYAFIIYNEGSSLLPLYKNQYNYVMTEKGTTFSNLTYKDKTGIVID